MCTNDIELVINDVKKGYKQNIVGPWMRDQECSFTYPSKRDNCPALTSETPDHQPYNIQHEFIIIF